MATKKQVVLSGYYGFDNTGDEAVLLSIIQALYKECGKDRIEIMVLSNQPEKTSRTYGVKAINRWDIPLIFKTIKNSDLLISGGGSLLQDETGNKTIPYYLLIMKIAQLCKKEIVFYGQGYGPVSKWHNKFMVKRVLNKVEHIFVRDIDSKASLKEIGVKQPIIVTVDPVIAMETSKELSGNIKDILNSKKDKVRLGIYLRSWKDDQLLVDKIKDLCQLLDKEDIEIFFIPMHYPEDVEFLQEIPQGNYHKIRDKLEVEEVLALTGQMDLVIGMRLHALIMAVAQGVPVVALSYDPKVDAFMKLIANENCFDVGQFSPQEVAKSVVCQVSNIKKQKESILYKRQVLLDKVYEPAKRVGEVLMKGGDKDE